MDAPAEEMDDVIDIATVRPGSDGNTMDRAE